LAQLDETVDNSRLGDGMYFAGSYQSGTSGWEHETKSAALTLSPGAYVLWVAVQATVDGWPFWVPSVDPDLPGGEWMPGNPQISVNTVVDLQPTTAVPEPSAYAAVFGAISVAWAGSKRLRR